jgi:hypothetical protein
MTDYLDKAIRPSKLPHGQEIELVKAARLAIETSKIITRASTKQRRTPVREEEQGDLRQCGTKRQIVFWLVRQRLKNG